MPWTIRRMRAPASYHLGRRQASAEIFRCGTEDRELQKTKNSGNEAKKYLKTKDITFLMLQNARILRAYLHKSSTARSKNGAPCAKRSETSESKDGFAE
jgi:hypothetical protein